MEYIYLNYGGFDLLILPKVSENYSLSYVKNISVVNWKYFLILRRTVRFQAVFKTLIDNFGKGLYYLKTYFFETRGKPLELILAVLNPQTILILDSNVPYETLIKRLVANPMYGETVIMSARIQEIPVELEIYDKEARFSQKIFLELTPKIFSRGLGRITLLKLHRDADISELTVCVAKEGVLMESSGEKVKMKISSLDRCLP